jgi:hypothetical protein
MQRFLGFAPYQFLILTIWTLVALTAFPLASKVNQELDASTTLQGSEWAAVEASLQQRFKSPFAKIALLRIVGAPSPRTPEGRRRTSSDMCRACRA